MNVEFQQAITVATQVARTEALIDAEKAVLDRRDRLHPYQLSEARTLNLAADAIRKLRA